jgi:hypothetical protein
VFRLDGWKVVPPTEEALKRDLLLSPFHVAIYSNRRFHQLKGDTIIEIENCPPSPYATIQFCWSVMARTRMVANSGEFRTFGVLGGVIKVLLRSGEAVRIRMAQQV